MVWGIVWGDRAAIELPAAGNEDSAVMGWVWVDTAAKELPAAGNKARRSATGKEAERLEAIPRGEAGDAAIAGEAEAEGPRGEVGDAAIAGEAEAEGPRGEAGDAAIAGVVAEAEGPRVKAGDAVIAAGAVNVGVTGAG